MLPRSESAPDTSVRPRPCVHGAIGCALMRAVFQNCCRARAASLGNAARAAAAAGLPPHIAPPALCRHHVGGVPCGVSLTKRLLSGGRQRVGLARGRASWTSASAASADVIDAEAKVVDGRVPVTVITGFLGCVAPDPQGDTQPGGAGSTSPTVVTLLSAADTLLSPPASPPQFGQDDSAESHPEGQPRQAHRGG